MWNPTVSFVVPCYKLAHLLPDCIRSILSQTYGDFEVLIMDDCSPDNTADIAGAFSDPRVIHIRNNQNLGHLLNYNKGIGLARGKYVWLISADDYLRQPYVLQRYVNALNGHPNVGYAFCPGIGVTHGIETEVLDYSISGARDQIIAGHTWLKRLLRRNVVLAASGMARRACYQSLGTFPLNMPWAGDWYLWCLFAVYYDVAYFAEPMVCYRDHALSMTNHLTKQQAEACCEEELAIPWIIKQRADEAGFRGVSRECLRAVAEAYAEAVVSKRYGMSRVSMSLDQFEESLCQKTASERERTSVRAHVYARMGNEYYWQGNIASAKQFYQAALAKSPLMARVAAKRVLLSLGGPGNALRRLVRSSPSDRILGRRTASASSET
jgi:glycosyltransferase involved in cell wall biosynthesis